MINKSVSESLQVDYNVTFLVKSSILVTLCSFSMGKVHLGYQMGILNTTELQISTYYNWESSKFYYVILAMSLFCIGASFGALCSGKVINGIGRRKGILLNNFSMLVFICLSVIPNQICFFVLRFFVGICVGICSTIPPIFINEISPREVKCTLGVFIQFMINLGIFMSYIVGGISNYCLSGYWSWALPFLFPCTIIVGQNYYLLERFNYDSPKWLLFNNRQSDIERIMRKIYKPWAWQSRISELEEEKSSIKSIAQDLPGLITRSISRPITLAYILCIFQQLTGINVSIFFSKVTLSRYEDFSSISIMLTEIIGFVNFLLVLPCFCLVKSVSRRFLLLQGFFGLFLCYSSLVAVFYFDTKFYPHWLELIIIFLSLGFYETSLGPIVWIYITELISFEWIGSAVCIQWLCSGGISIIIPLIFEYGGLFEYQITYGCFAVACVFGFALIYNFTIDTKDAKIEELAERFSKKDSTIEH